MDFEGIGDSVLRSQGRENHPYPETATADVHGAIEFLKRELGATRFVVMGLCSGAHAAFHAGLDLDHDIAEVVLINPLTFHWEEGMTLDTNSYWYDLAAYRRSVRDAARWGKLLRGEVNVRRFFKVIMTHAVKTIGSAWSGACEAVLPWGGSRLVRDLNRLLARERLITLVVAEGDPGFDILLSGARRTVRRALRTGRMRKRIIPAADHTFSQERPRAEMIDAVRSLLAFRYGE
jgi:dienelactone hydrolase